MATAITKDAASINLADPLAVGPEFRADVSVAPGGAMGAQALPVIAVPSLSGILQQPAVKKSIPAILVLGVLLLIAALYTWMQDTPYRTVFAGMMEADQQSAMEALKVANFNPRLDPNSGQVTVPGARYHEARILLASQGIPKAAGRGILDSLKDQSALTTSQFMEQARYSAAIEQELAKSIMQIGTIQIARVHLAQTKQSAFVRDNAPIKASVVVTPFPGRVVAASQVQAIINLVASSVPYLAVDHVSVVDNQGNLLTKGPGDAAFALTSMQTQLKQQSEEVYRRSIVQLLETIVGEGNVRAHVDLEMDYNQVETASEDFDASKRGPKTRSESLSQEQSAATEPGGVPGATSNTPPEAAAASTDTAGADASKPGAPARLNNKSTRNFELDKTVRHVKTAPGSINRVSVAVLIKDRTAADIKPAAQNTPAAPGAPAAPVTEAQSYTPEELTRMSNLVKGVVGFKEDRGDSVNLVPAKFELTPIIAPDVPWHEKEGLINYLKIALVTLVALVALFTVARPLVKFFTQPPAVAALSNEAAETAEAAVSMAEGESLDDFKARLKQSGPKKSGISADMLDTANTYDDKVALVRMLVQEDSGRVANVLKNMIKRG